MRLFVSYTLRDGYLDTSILMKVKELYQNCDSCYIDIIDNDSVDKQGRVEQELLSADTLLLIETTTKLSHLWLCDPNRPEEGWKNFLTRFLESSKDTIITSTDKEHTILKKYEMQRFTSQSEADKVIADFAKLVKDNTGVKFFKENFYRNDIL